MVNLACLHVTGASSSFLRCGTETFDYGYGSYDPVTRTYRKITTFEYPLEVQDRAVQSSGLMPVVVFLRKTTKSYSNNSSYNYSSYNSYTYPDKHTSVDIANCFWVEKGASLTQLPQRPAGALLAGSDPFAEDEVAWKRWLVVAFVLLAAFAGVVYWH